MASVFRTEVCLPPLFYELLKERATEGATTDTFSEVYSEVFGTAPTEQQLAAILSRLVAEADELATKGPPPSRSKLKKKHFCTGFADYLSGLNVEQLCFFLGDFNPEKAKQLYCATDIKLVEMAAISKIGYLMELSGVWYEAVMFGMGGHYKGGGPNDNVIDLTEDATAGLAALKNLGLM